MVFLTAAAFLALRFFCLRRVAVGVGVVSVAVFAEVVSVAVFVDVVSVTGVGVVPVAVFVEVVPVTGVGVVPVAVFVDPPCGFTARLRLLLYAA